jgi:transcriptional regulator with XRE-family HTH domain
MAKVEKAPAEAVQRIKEGKALEGIRALRSQLIEGNPAYAAAVDLENSAESFCRDVRNNLREQRKGLGLDQKAVGDLLDLTQSAVSKIESGEGDLGLKTVFRYAHALGLVPVCMFLPDSEQLFPEKAAAAAKITRKFQTEFVKDTSNALSQALTGLARSLSEE